MPVVDGAAVGPLLAEFGQAVRALTAGTDARLLGLPPGDLTVTIGIGPRLVGLVDPALPGATDLPQFSHERIAPQARGGDLLLRVACRSTDDLQHVVHQVLSCPGVTSTTTQVVLKTRVPYRVGPLLEHLSTPPSPGAPPTA